MSQSSSDIDQEKIATKFDKASQCALWVGDPINIHKNLFVKKYYLNLNFFQVLQSALLKNENKEQIFSKNIKSLEIARSKRRILKKREWKMKNEKESNNNNKYLFTFTFLFRTTFILLENMFGNTYFILLHLYYSFSAWQVIGNAAIKHHHPYRYAMVL